MKSKHAYIVLIVCVAAGALAGCDGAFGRGRADPRMIKPTVAVMSFENRARFPIGWDLSDGMRDVLVDRLVSTGRFTVIERPEIRSVMSELRLQNSGATRKQRRAALGRLKNVQYLVKGTITDFGHVSTSRGLFNGGGWSMFGGSTKAVMGMTMYVVEVESGEIICSESITESVRASDVAVKAEYNSVSFGGSTFYRKPLGRATAKVIGKAVERISNVVACRPWLPKIALVQPGGVIIINGGSQRGVAAGSSFDVYDVGDPIIDPDTGDTIGVQPGRVVGRIRISRVMSRYSQAVIVLGKAAGFRIGQHCRAVQLVASK